ncbi:MAG: hypothetical protein IPL63_11890 [Saprospiraceae bacterium]|nr:hypothetical protein [Saprospiraceae bacterium]MBK6566954.1 hypothetical protein [Saprospiraceae bacterium]MBK8548037.1 hypothetical protein [Saprospiraceae bacterium]
MKRIVLHIIILLFPLILSGQESIPDITGTVSYKTSKNIYVRFENTKNINVDDTLSVQKNGIWIKVLIVRQKSSSSCVTENISTEAIETGQIIAFFTSKQPEPKKEPIREETIIQEPILPAETMDTFYDGESKKKSLLKKQLTTGRITFSTNGSINPDNQNNFQRIRAAASLQIRNIHHSSFSLESYVTYRHRYGIDQSTTDFYDDFKVFSAAVLYQPGTKYNLTFGRKNNQNIANLGVIDGVQGEYLFSKYTLGTFAGTRPDFNNFTYNASLPQFGLYLVRNDNSKTGMAQTSLAIAEQLNDFKTDRRFLYFQHNNSLFKNLNLFFSSELDLFKKINNEAKNEWQLTSIYASLRYRVKKNLSLSGSYDNRRNIIYYESYQTFIDQLLAQETRQGLRFQINYTAFSRIFTNVSAFYRFQGDNPQPTKNYIANININRILRNSTNLSLSGNLLESYYFKGTILGLRLNDNFFKGKLNAELQYRNVNYTFNNTETGLKQHIAGINLTFQLLKKTSVICSYEGTYEPLKVWHRYFITISQRIKNDK